MEAALTLTLGTQSYELRPDTSMRKLERRIVAAMRRGAGVVRLPLVTGREVDALVSPALPVTLEQRTPQGAGDASWVPDHPVDWLDLELGREL